MREIDWNRISVLATKVIDILDADFSGETMLEIQEIARKKIMAELEESQ